MISRSVIAVFLCLGCFTYVDVDKPHKFPWHSCGGALAGGLQWRSTLSCYGSTSTINATVVDMGKFGYYCDDCGTSGSFQRIGKSTYWWDNRGTAGWAQQIGKNWVTWSDNHGRFGTCNRIGNHVFCEDSEGTMATYTQIGNFGFYSDNRGRTGTLMKFNYYGKCGDLSNWQPRSRRVGGYLHSGWTPRRSYWYLGYDEP